MDDEPWSTTPGERQQAERDHRRRGEHGEDRGRAHDLHGNEGAHRSEARGEQSASELAGDPAGQRQDDREPREPDRHLLVHHQEGDEDEEGVLHRDVEQHDQRERREAAPVADAPVGAANRGPGTRDRVRRSHLQRAEQQEEGDARDDGERAVTGRDVRPGRPGAEQGGEEPGEEELPGVAARVVRAERGAPRRPRKGSAYQRRRESMLERGSAPRDAEPDEEPRESARHRHHEVAGARAKKPEREQAALAEALREHPGRKLEEPHRTAVGGADEAHLGEAEAEGLSEDREQDVDRGGEPVLNAVRRAARRKRHLPPHRRPCLAHVSSAVPNTEG